MRLADAVEQHLARCAANGRSPKTITRYGSCLEDLVASVPPEPTVTDIINYIIGQREGRSHNGHRYIVALIRVFFNSWLQVTEVPDEITLCTAVLKQAQMPRRHDIDIRVPTDAEVNALIESTTLGQQGWRDQLAVLVMADLGCRVGELCALRWNDVELGRGVIHVGEKRGKRRILPISLPDRLYKAWIARLRYYQQRQRKRQSVPEPHYVMSRYIDKPPNPSSIVNLLARHSAAAGIKRITPHQLRYYFGAKHADTMSPIMIRHYLGHSSLVMTMQYLDKAGISLPRMEAAMERSLQLRTPLEVADVPPRVLD